MKTIFKIALVLVLSVSAQIASAAGNLKLWVDPVSDAKAMVGVSSLTNESVSLIITDEVGNIVYYRECFGPSENFSKLYDLSNLENGVYKIAVTSKGLTTGCVFRKNPRSIVVGEESTVQKPYFVFEKGCLKFTYLNFMNDKVKLYLYQGNEMVFSKKIGDKFSISDGLNLKKLEAGDYMVCLVSGDNEFYYNIQK